MPLPVNNLAINSYTKILLDLFEDVKDFYNIVCNLIL